MSFPINRHDLKPGYWVVFGHEKESIPEELVGPFKVLTRDDAMFDACSCFLMNDKGELLLYCPRMCSLNHNDLPWNYNVRVLSKEDVNKTFGSRVEELHSKAVDHLKSMAQRGKFFGVGFDPDNETDEIDGQGIRDRYGLTFLKN